MKRKKKKCGKNPRTSKTKCQLGFKWSVTGVPEGDEKREWGRKGLRRDNGQKHFKNDGRYQPTDGKETYSSQSAEY